MKLSEKWLRGWVDPSVSTDQLVTQLTSLGLEVDSAEPVVAGKLSGVVVGEVLDVQPHPDAERLRVCAVRSAPDAEPVSVVCGAPNVFAGMKAPIATVGARLPDGTKIRRSKLRGVESQGMLCSVRELGLGDEHEGILALEPSAPVGADLVEHLGLGDTVIDVDLTPNRGDCLSVAGVAREVGVINRVAFDGPALEPVPAECEDTFGVVLEEPSLCPRYVGRVIRAIDPTAHTPLWMVERLRRSGIRAISPVVDVSNYVMLEIGHPMHAFDLGRLAGGIRVRRAQPGEQLTLLDGEELSLDPESLVIADHERPVALGGIKGGLDSGVTAETQDIFLECAWFEPRMIAVEARRRGLHTDASHRFERGVATDTQSRAVERATALLLDIVGGRPGPTVDTHDPDSVPQRPRIRLRASRIERLLGVCPEPAVVTDVLTRLGMVVEADGLDAWHVTAPSFRHDVSIEADLIEEIARIVGYDSIPEHAPASVLTMTARPESRVEVRSLRARLIERGYQEAITYSFVDPAMQALLEPETEAIPLSNPISSDLAVMRTSLWPGLLGALLYNLNRQQGRVRLMETGLVFLGRSGDLAQVPMIGGVVAGPVDPEQWDGSKAGADFFDVKSDVEALIAQSGDESAEFVAGSHPALHPGQCAEIRRAGVGLGWIGAVHPRVTADWRLSSRVIAFELRLDALQEGHVPRFQALSKFPAIRRDISLAVDESVTARSVRDCVGQSGVDVLKNLELFDVYRGEGVDSGKKSLSLGLTFQASSRTLNDQEVDEHLRTILHLLATNLGGELRG